MLSSSLQLISRDQSPIPLSSSVLFDRFMGSNLRIILAISGLFLLSISGLASVPSKDSLGIAPQDEGYYKSSVIKCKDGSKKFTKEQLNDEFCDCPDGTDEPGTSACPEGKFYCRNFGHIPLTIFSSRVNDGICDCCDGSDEYQSNVKCPNTCWEAGKATREKLKKKIATYQEGVNIRKEEVEKAKRALVKDQEELVKLQSEEKVLKGLVQNLKEQKERIEKAEEAERQKKEAEEKKLREEQKKANEEEGTPDESLHDISDTRQEEISASTKQDGHGTALEAEFRHSVEAGESNDHAKVQPLEEDHDDAGVQDGNGVDVPSVEGSSTKVRQHVGAQDDPPSEINANAETKISEASTDHLTNQEEDSSIDTEKLSKAELGRLVASRWTGENAPKESSKNAVQEEQHSNNQVKPGSDRTPEEYSDDYTSETDEDKKYNDDIELENSDDEFEDDHSDATESYVHGDDDKTDFSDETVSTTLSWLDKIHQTVQNVLQAFNFFRTPVDISEGDRVRREYDNSNSKLSKIRARISSLNEKLKHDFGKETEFYSFYGQCFENKQNKYVYKVCPFKQATQVEGHSTTRLGNWDKFEESYTVMQFHNGDRCWNGPDRSLKAKLRCGLKNELTDVDEPSRCEYVALLSTPASCTEEKLKELQQKLEKMNSNQPPSHDEL